MMNHKGYRLTMGALMSGVLSLGLASPCLAAKQSPTPANTIPVESYYKVPAVFVPFPEPGKTWSIKYYGPVGIGIDLINPPFTMCINNVEKGSPADATGLLKKGQIIESINGETLKDIDPRVQLGQILEKAEATDGLMKLKIKDQGVVDIKLPVLGAYSATWPLNCPKSARIVRNLGDRFASLETPVWSAGPFLLSTGEEKDLETYRRWIKSGAPDPSYPWYIGLYGTSVCEYYLRTGDQSVIPAINKMATTLKESMYDGGWMGRGSVAPNFRYMGGGHMNAAGVHALNFLMLAKECGAEVDEYLLQRVLLQFYRFAGHGNVAYGNQLPEGGFRDNGKTAGLALAMSSAASLSPDGERSVYAAVRDNSAMKSFYATTWFNRAHTGGGIGEIWHGVAMQLMADKKPVQYRSFMDERKWFYELSRHFDGSFGVHDGMRYDAPDWGNYFAMAYTASRKKLRMFGAPKTPWCKTYPLPARPWGTAADDAYFGVEPAELVPGKVVLDVSHETILTDASGPLMKRLSMTNTTDKTTVMYTTHPDYGIRSAVSALIAKQGRYHLITPLLKSADPRIREVGVLTITGMFKGMPIPPEAITSEMMDLVIAMINNPEESRWVVMQAMTALSRAPVDKIVPQVDRLLYFLKQTDDWWVQAAALKPLSVIAGDERAYQKVLPAVGEMVARNTAMTALGLAGEISKAITSANPEVQKLGLSVLLRTYKDVPDPLLAPGGANLATGARIIKGTVSGWITALPGGGDLVLKMPKMTSAWAASKKDSDMYVYNGAFTPNPLLMGKWQTVAIAKSAADYQAQLEKQAADEAKRKAAEATAKKNGKPLPAPKKKNSPKFGIGSLVLQDGGSVGGTRGYVWSGDMLINSGNQEAQKMTINTDLGKEYLFVETGGFSSQNETVEDETPWDPSYYVMERKK